MPTELGDSVVVVADASSGMGLATAHSFARRGANVVLAPGAMPCSNEP